jgi:membrane fusion protein (multidrug efflux system)
VGGPASRTLLTEIRMPNEGGVLRPGMYADVKFHVVRPNPPFLLPSTAIIIRSGPPRVAVVDANGVVRLPQVELGRDFGSTIEVTSGLNEQDRLIAVPADNVQDGMTVRPASGPASSAPAQH